MSPKPSDFAGPPCLYNVCYGTYVLPNLCTNFYFCVLRIMYARHVAKMASLLSAWAPGASSKLEAVAHEESDIWTIYCIVLPRETYNSSKVGGVCIPYALVEIRALETDSTIERCERYFQVAESISPLSWSTHGRTLNVLQTRI